MDRTVPRTGGDEIQLYMRTYYSLLRSTDTIQIETLVESHIAIESSLHVKARELDPDISALIYSALRIPSCIKDADLVLVGQIEKAVIEAGYTDIRDWERVFAPGRRRRMHFDGDHTLLVYIVSRSDIDDLIPILTAYQIEWNKLHMILQDSRLQEFLEARVGREGSLSGDEAEELGRLMKISARDVQRLEIVWQEEFFETLQQIAQTRKQMGVRLLSGSLMDYRRATANWWDELRAEVQRMGIDPEAHPVYFVSSNTHSLVNLLTGFARRHETSLTEFLKSQNHETLLAEYEELQQQSHKSLENFLYYVLRRYLSQKGDEARYRLQREERSVGIYRVPNRHGFEIEAQIIALRHLEPSWLDTRLMDSQTDLQPLEQSDALILNIDYPLGMSAYEILTRIAERVGRVLGIYIMGKAATLNGRIGDVMIPNVIHDEHSQNTYLFDNCFRSRDVRPYMSFGNVLDNQKAVTALGTFLQNPVYMDVFYREGYTDIEMEGGPYLSAVYESFRPKRHPIDEIVNMYQVPFDLGVLHYASDTPMKKGQNLGAGSLQYTGVEPTYATAIAILRRIFKVELARMGTKQGAPSPLAT